MSYPSFMRLVPGRNPETILHTGAAVWMSLDGSRVLRIPGSPFAALPDSREKHSWHIFFVEGRREIGWTRGDRRDARIRMV